MCGIAGVFRYRSERPIDTSVLSEMVRRLRHRGPDDEGTHLSGRAALAHTRLSIIDLVGGHQPMHTNDGVSIVFNGEIYNYLALRSALIARGYRFRSKSDTEVVLNLYHADGADGLRKLSGMFAVAIHDGRNDELVLVRDQIGIKPQ